MTRTRANPDPDPGCGVVFESWDVPLGRWSVVTDIGDQIDLDANYTPWDSTAIFHSMVGLHGVCTTRIGTPEVWVSGRDVRLARRLDVNPDSKEDS